MTMVREVTGGDAEQVRVTAAAALTFDPEAADLPESLSHPPTDRTWTALVAADGAGVVFASVSGRIGYVDLVAVHPDQQGRGLGRALLTHAEEWMRGQGAAEARFAGHPPCYAWPGIDVRYTPAQCLALRAGYERYDMAWNMTADLSRDLSVDDDLRRLAGRGVQVRSVAASDRGDVIEFVRANWNDNWAWEAEHAEGCHVAVREGESGRDAVLGFAAWGARPLWFGPMGTADEAQGLGIGRVLLRRCLAEQRSAGRTHAQIGWVGPLRFYSRAVGARVERVFAMYRRNVD